MKTITLLLALFSLLLVGCSGGSEGALLGKYKGEIKLTEEQKKDPMAKMAEGMMGLFAMDLELKAEKKFTLTVMGMPIEGDWVKSGNTLTLTPTLIMGLTPEEAKKQNKSGTMSKEADKPLRLEVQPDGKSLKALDDMGGGKTPGDFIFTKQG